MNSFIKIRQLNEKGNTNVLTVVPILLIFPLLMFCFTVTQAQLTKEKTQDALAASNLATAMVDHKELNTNIGDNRRNVIVEISSTGYSQYDLCGMYKTALQGNLGLLEDSTGQLYKYDALINGNVTIESLIYYNVYDVPVGDTFVRTVDVYEMSESSGIMTLIPLSGNPSDCTDSAIPTQHQPPTREYFLNNLDTNSSIYSRISFPTKGFAERLLNDSLSVQLSQLSDVRANYSLLNKEYE